MARKARKTQQDQAATQTEVTPESSEKEHDASAPEAEAETQSQDNQQDQAATQLEAGQEKPGETESHGDTEKKAQSSGKKANAKTKSGMVDAVLKTRHCRGGRCKEAGENMPMTQGEYNRLKKYDRVE